MGDFGPPVPSGSAHGTVRAHFAICNQSINLLINDYPILRKAMNKSINCLGVEILKNLQYGN